MLLGFPGWPGEAPGDPKGSQEVSNGLPGSASWASLWRSWRLLGLILALLAAPGAHFGPSWRLLAAPGAHFGAPGAYFGIPGGSGGSPERSFKPLTTGKTRSQTTREISRETNRLRITRELYRRTTGPRKTREIYRRTTRPRKTREICRGTTRQTQQRRRRTVATTALSDSAFRFLSK